MRCGYCRRDMPDDSFAHAVCSSVFSRRLDAKTCVQCGRSDAAKNNIRCKQCTSHTTGREYRGYPGGAA